MPRVNAVRLSVLRERGAVHVTRLGVPCSVVSAPDHSVKAFVSICAHDWIVMNECVLTDGCLVCPKHLATFSSRDGSVVDARGKKIAHGLQPVIAQINGDDVTIDIRPEHLMLVATAWGLRRLRFVRKLARRFRF